MKSLLNIKLFALLLGAAFAFAGTVDTKASKLTTYTYGRLADGTWVPIDDTNYQCNASESICKGSFTYQNPPQNAVPNTGMSLPGVYELKP